MAMNWRQGTLVLVAAMVFGGLIASGLSQVPAGDERGRPSVVASTYPLGYMVDMIAGDDVRLTVLMPPNQEVHAFHPTTRDWLEANSADVLLYNGAGADPWFEGELLPDLDTRDKLVVDTTEGLQLLEAHGDGHDGEDTGDADPHTWLSPAMALQQAQAIYEAIRQVVPDDIIDWNWKILRSKLEALDSQYESTLSNATLDEIIVSHEAYGYLADRYGFEQHGVIGISAEEQPSVAAMSDLVDLMEDRGVYSVFVDPVYSDDYARTIQEELEDRTGREVEVLTLYFCLGPVGDMDYLQQMRANLDALATALEVPP